MKSNRVQEDLMSKTIKAREYLLYKDCIHPLLQLDDVQKLDKFTQHIGTNRLHHCLSVSYYSFVWCRYLKLDYRSAARAGLMHDLFLYNLERKKQSKIKHIFTHPKVALKNAKKNVHLNSLEEDAILNHMWPLSGQHPRYFESFIVSFSDKYVTIGEVVKNFTKIIKLRFRRFVNQTR
jgi:uncharacterized protein